MDEQPVVKGQTDCPDLLLIEEELEKKQENELVREVSDIP